MVQPESQFGEFVLRREIGRGSMGTVWEARQPSLDRTVALKILAGPTANDPTWIRRFRAEAGAAARLSHPGILPVYGIGTTGTHHWFAMELVHGEDLAARLARRGPMPPREAAAVIRQAALALHHAHEHGVVHRDVKPANLMVRDDGRVTVTDFGLAKHVGSGALTTTGLLLGTPYYMSPELVNARGSQEIGPRSDVYGLGATLYELLTGRPPFEGPTAMALLKQIGEKAPQPPTQLDPTIPRDLETITLTCLRKRPERRYADAADLAEDLQRFLDHQPVATRRPGPIEHAVRFVAQNRLAAVVALVGLLLLLGASVFFTTAMRSQEAAYERRIRALLDRADRLADAGDVEAAEDLYSKAEEVAQTAPHAGHRAQQARAGRQLVRLLQTGLLEPEALPGAAVWRNAPPGRIRVVTTPPNAAVHAMALPFDGLEEDVDWPRGGGAVEPGLYRLELTAPGRVRSVVTVTAIPGMDLEIDVDLPVADERAEGMVAYLGTWRPTRHAWTTARGTPTVHRHGEPFLLDERRTTNAEYGAFLASRPEDLRPSLVPTRWSGGRPPAETLDEPVQGLTREQGRAYAAWRGKRLPAPVELRAAAMPELVTSVVTLHPPAATDGPRLEEGHLVAVTVDPEAAADLGGWRRPAGADAGLRLARDLAD